MKGWPPAVPLSPAPLDARTGRRPHWGKAGIKDPLRRGVSPSGAGTLQTWRGDDPAQGRAAGPEV